MVQHGEIQAGMTRANAITDTTSFNVMDNLNSREYYNGNDIAEGTVGLDGKIIERSRNGEYRDDIPAYMARAGIYDDGMRAEIEKAAENIPSPRIRDEWVQRETDKLDRTVLTMKAQDLSNMRKFQLKEWEMTTEGMAQEGNWGGVFGALATYPGDANGKAEWRVKAVKGQTVQQLSDILNTNDYEALAASYGELGGTQEDYAKKNKFQGLTSKERSAWRGQVKRSMDNQDNFALADAAVQKALDAHPDNLTDARAALRKSLQNKPDALKDALKLYDSAVSRRDKEQKQIKKNLIDSTQTVIAAKGVDAELTDVPPVSEYFSQTERDAAVDQVIKQQKGFVKTSQPGTVNTVRDMQANQPEKFLNYDLDKVRHKLSEKDYLDLYNQQAEAKAGITEMSETGTTVWNKQMNSWVKSFVNPGDSMAKWSTDDHKKAAQISELAQADYRREVLSKGRDLTYVERNDLLNNIATIYGETKGSWYNPSSWFSSQPDVETIQANRRDISKINNNFETLQLQVPHTAQVQQILANVDADRMQRIEDRRRSAGLSLDKSIMMAEYLRDYNRMYPITGFKDNNEYR